MKRRSNPIEEYVAALAGALHGPARVKARMIEEIRGGLDDTAEAHTRQGMRYPRAAHQAVREFGTIDELAPSCQRELTIVQTRHTARAVALTAPFLIACWYLIWTADVGESWQLTGTAQLLAVVAAIATLLAAATLAATGALGRRLPTPHRLPLVVAWTGTTAGVAMAITTLALAVASFLATNWLLTALAGTLTVASHGVVAASARACRQCARLAR